MTPERGEAEMPSTVTRSPDVIAKSVGGEVVLVDVKTNRIYELNKTAGRLWALLGEGLSLDEIEARLADEYSVDRDQVRAEIDGLVAELLEQQLLQRD